MKAILFDMDGLMVDTERLYIETESALAESFGKKLTEETIGEMMGKKAVEAMAIYIRDLGLSIEVEEMIRIRDRLYEEKLRAELVPLPGLFEMLQEYRNTLSLAIATGSSRKFLDIVLEKLKIREYFQALQTADEIVHGKPDPEIYIKTAGKLGIPPAECIILEDSQNGALAGKRAGCYTIAIPSPYTCKQDFSFVDYRAAALHEARQHIREKFFQE